MSLRIAAHDLDKLSTESDSILPRRLVHQTREKHRLMNALPYATNLFKAHARLFFASSCDLLWRARANGTLLLSSTLFVRAFSSAPCLVSRII